MTSITGSFYGRSYVTDPRGDLILTGDQVALKAEFYEGLFGRVVQIDLRRSSEGYSIIVDIPKSRRHEGGRYAFRPTEVEVLR